ncbi:MAG: hypothetical protein JST82_00235 [Bacteroidetes bacterium]|nr:hypothetical protein [Bacteroidota bacterium]
MQSNINIVKEYIKHFGQKDINAMLQLLSDDVEWGEPEIRISQPVAHAKGTQFPRVDKYRLEYRRDTCFRAENNSFLKTFSNKL